MTEAKMATGPSRAEIQPYTMSTSAVAEKLPDSGPKPPRPGRRRLSKRGRLLLLNAVSIVGGIAIWWVLALNGFQFPTPPEVVAKAVQLWQAGILQQDILASLGRVLTGRVQTGKALVNMPVRAIQPDGNIVENARLTKLLSFRGIERVPVEEAEAGDIIAIAGLAETTVADTICDPVVEVPLPAQPIDPPTLAMTFSVNDSPLAGREGSMLELAVMVVVLIAIAVGIFVYGLNIYLRLWI